MLDFDRLSSRWGKYHVLVVGDVMVDTLWDATYSRASPEGIGDVLTQVRKERFPGGAGNVAQQLRALGAGVTLIGARGDDENGRWLSQILARMGVDFRPIFTGGATTTKTRIYQDGKLLTRIDHDQVLPAGALWPGVDKGRGFDAVLLSDYQKGMLYAPGTQVPEYLGTLRENLARVYRNDWELQLYLNVKPALLKEMWGYRKALATFNDTEFGELPPSGCPTPLGTAEELNINRALWTRGKSGVLLADRQQRLFFGEPGHPVECVDVCGAGDATFAGAVLATLDGHGGQWIARVANACGAAKVMQRGTKAVRLADVRRLVEEANA